jgi:hypothetical protein
MARLSFACWSGLGSGIKPLVTISELHRGQRRPAGVSCLILDQT